MHVLGLIVFTSAVSIFLSAVNVYLRDTQHLTEVLLMAWFWGTSIVYTERIDDVDQIRAGVGLSDHHRQDRPTQPRGSTRRRSPTSCVRSSNTSSTSWIAATGPANLYSRLLS